MVGRRVGRGIESNLPTLQNFYKLQQIMENTFFFPQHRCPRYRRRLLLNLSD